jgi:hypothetical protein
MTRFQPRIRVRSEALWKGRIFVGPKDLAVLTDGATLISFDVTSGDVKHQEFFPEKGARIVSFDDNGQVLVERGGKPGIFDSA